jgi:hypothetical protein
MTKEGGVDEPQTCGRGLAENSVVPAKLADVAGAMAEVLEVHMRALDLTDENARTELDAYTKLVRDWRAIAANLQMTAERMAGYRDLPMTRHDEQAMAALVVRDAFRTFVTAKRDLLTLLRQQAEGDERMLAEMDG